MKGSDLLAGGTPTGLSAKSFSALVSVVVSFLSNFNTEAKVPVLFKNFSSGTPVFLKYRSSISQVAPAKVDDALGVQFMERAGEKRPVTILIVDDSDDLRELMVFQIQNLGYQTAEATNGLEAIEVAQKTSPSLILMDINMPLLDGLAATRVIRESGQFSNTAIVAFSAYLGGVHRALALEAGCNEFLSKIECVDKLEHILGRFAPLRRVDSDAATTKP